MQALERQAHLHNNRHSLDSLGRRKKKSSSSKEEKGRKYERTFRSKIAHSTVPGHASIAGQLPPSPSTVVPCLSSSQNKNPTSERIDENEEERKEPSFRVLFERSSCGVVVSIATLISEFFFS